MSTGILRKGDSGLAGHHEESPDVPAPKTPESASKPSASLHKKPRHGAGLPRDESKPGSEGHDRLKHRRQATDETTKRRAGKFVSVSNYPTGAAVTYRKPDPALP